MSISRIPGEGPVDALSLGFLRARNRSRSGAAKAVRLRAPPASCPTARLFNIPSGIYSAALRSSCGGGRPARSLAADPIAAANTLETDDREAEALRVRVISRALDASSIPPRCCASRIDRSGRSHASAFEVRKSRQARLYRPRHRQNCEVRDQTIVCRQKYVHHRSCCSCPSGRRVAESIVRSADRNSSRTCALCLAAHRGWRLRACNYLVRQLLNRTLAVLRLFRNSSLCPIRPIGCRGMPAAGRELCHVRNGLSGGPCSIIPITNADDLENVFVPVMRDLQDS